MPVFQTNGISQGSYNCGDNAYQKSYTGVTAAEREAYIKLLLSEHFTVAAPEVETAGNLFNSYYKDGTGVHLSYYPGMNGTFKIVTDVKGYEPARTKQAYQTLATPTLAQLERSGAADTAPGMQYVIQLSDGRFILIDGGNGGHPDDCAALLAYLQEKKPEAHQKPIIAGWFFTHAHGDHMGLACNFLQAYAGDIELQAMYANFPLMVEGFMQHEATSPWLKQCYDDFNALMDEHFPTAPRYKFQSGEVFWIADAKIEILFTHQDYFPQAFQYGNDTSSAFRITVGETQAVFLGDVDVRSCPTIAAMYGENLKCDILQVTHHGFNGGTLGLYKLLDPDICLWSVDQERFENYELCTGTASGYDFNKWLRATTGTNGERTREHYHNSTTVILPLV